MINALSGHRGGPQTASASGSTTEPASTTASTPSQLMTLVKWMAQMLEKDIPSSEGEFHSSCKDGQILCELINKIKPNTISKINKSHFTFKHMENLESFLKSAVSLGYSEQIFAAGEFYEGRNLQTTIQCLLKFAAFISKCSWYSGIKITLPAEQSRAELQTKRRSVHPVWTGTEESASPSVPSTGSLNKRPVSRASLLAPRRISTFDQIDPEADAQIRSWINAMLGISLPRNCIASMKDGVLLCQLLNKIVPNTIPPSKIIIPSPGKTLTQPEMERNVAVYLGACTSVGITLKSLFAVSDLVQSRNSLAVLIHIQDLFNWAVKQPTYTGPKITAPAQPPAPVHRPNSILAAARANTVTTSSSSASVPASQGTHLFAWVNSFLERQGKKIVDPKQDFCDSTNLFFLIEELIGQNIGFYELIPTLPWHKLQNAALVVQLVSELCNSPPTCTPMDIVFGSVEPISRFLQGIQTSLDMSFIQKQLGPERFRCYVASALLKSENAYVTSLTQLLEDMIIPIKNALGTPKQILNREEMAIVFSHFEAIVTHHTMLLLNIQERLSSFNSAHKLGDIFTTKMEWLPKLYADYAANSENSFPTVQTLRHTNKAFAALLITCEQKWGKDFHAFISMPIRRVHIYKLYLQELLQATPHTHDDFPLIEVALRMFKSAVVSVGDCWALTDNNRKVQFIEESIAGSFDPLTGVYLREGFLVIADAGLEDTYFFLFNDRLIFTTYKKPARAEDKVFTFRSSFFVADFEEVIENDWEAPDGTHGHAIEVVTTNFSLILVSKSAEDKAEWLEALQGALATFKQLGS